MDFKTALVKFGTDFGEGALAGAIVAFESAPADAFLSPRTLIFVVVLGAFDGAISAARRAVDSAYEAYKAGKATPPAPPAPPAN